MTAPKDRVVEALRWALDLLDQYDEEMIRRGDPRDLVYSPIHVQGKRMARAVIPLAEATAAVVKAARTDHLHHPTRNVCSICDALSALGQVGEKT